MKNVVNPRMARRVFLFGGSRTKTNSWYESCTGLGLPHLGQNKTLDPKHGGFIVLPKVYESVRCGSEIRKFQEKPQGEP